MVKLWPWKTEDNTAASFEKALSALAEKISKSQTRLDYYRQRGRRAKALWTLYTSFAYVLCVIILLLVVGWRNWTALEYTGVAGSPLVFWLVRKAIAAYYDYCVDTLSERLEAQQKERTKTIDKLKAATKYNSTQELLEKYGGGPPKSKKELTDPKTPKNPQKPSEGRTSTGPQPRPLPVPANVRPGSQLSTPQPQQILQTHVASPVHPSPSPVYRAGPGGNAEFAPNAFSAPPQYAGGEINTEGHWYDRVLDLLLGDDETSPKNRVVLICKNCRLVNGQAPPGIKNLADLGNWRCFGCGTLNIVEDEVANAMKEMRDRIGDKEKTQEHFASSTDSKDEASGESGSGKEDIKHEVVEEADDNSDEDMVEVKPRRGRSGRKKTS